MCVYFRRRCNRVRSFVLCSGGKFNHPSTHSFMCVCRYIICEIIFDSTKVTQSSFALYDTHFGYQRLARSLGFCTHLSRISYIWCENNWPTFEFSVCARVCACADSPHIFIALTVCGVSTLNSTLVRSAEEDFDYVNQISWFFSLSLRALTHWQDEGRPPSLSYTHKHT